MAPSMPSSGTISTTAIMVGMMEIIHHNQSVTHVDLAKLPDADLVALQLHPNEWKVRHARRVLQERGPKLETQTLLLRYLNADGTASAPASAPGLLPDSDASRQLRLMWTLHVVGGFTEEVGLKLLKSPHDYVRAWSLQLLLEDGKPTDALLSAMAKLAESDPSPVVRLYLAAGLQRIEPSRRAPVISRLLKRVEDVNDHNLPLMYWYAAEPVVSQSNEAGLALLRDCRLPKVREFIARRIASAQK